MLREGEARMDWDEREVLVVVQNKQKEGELRSTFQEGKEF